MNTPVVDFPNYLFQTGRFGIMAPEQINAGEACATKMIGTGPFKLESYAAEREDGRHREPGLLAEGLPEADSRSRSCRSPRPRCA